MLDYPYIYPLAEEKLFCTHIDPKTNMRCIGMIDYDDGFNHLFCRKCGTRYLAVDLEDKNPINDNIINRGGIVPMKVSVVMSDGTKYEPIMSSSLIERRTPKPSDVPKKMKVNVVMTEVNNKTKEEKKIESISCTKDETVEVRKPIGFTNAQTENSEEENKTVSTEEVETTAELEEEEKVEEIESPDLESSTDMPMKSDIKEETEQELVEENDGIEIINKIAETEASRYPTGNKSYSVKKAGTFKTSGLSSKFIPSPGVIAKEE